MQLSRQNFIWRVQFMWFLACWVKKISNCFGMLGEKSSHLLWISHFQYKFFKRGKSRKNLLECFKMRDPWKKVALLHFTIKWHVGWKFFWRQNFWGVGVNFQVLAPKSASDFLRTFSPQVSVYSDKSSFYRVFCVQKSLGSIWVKTP